MERKYVVELVILPVILLVILLVVFIRHEILMVKLLTAVIGQLELLRYRP